MIPITADATETPVIVQFYKRREESATTVELDKPPYRMTVTTPFLTAVPGAESSRDLTPIQEEIDKAWSPHTRGRVQTYVDSGNGNGSVAESDTPDEAERIADQRALLLVQRYAMRGASKEQQARLNLLTERLKVLLPPVTEEELETLEQIAVSGQTIRQRFADIRRRLSIG